ncbi:tryptophan 7-halogenase [Saccharophagus degradans]|uniref:tryptophan halogenase family protein n=1 Tax=Saccharophagus degradans TaxID=86304 RepID=UPI0024782BC3|nr:tryptophan halogenase family protein [Saccharophagus degradans]WGO98563.1 tryptophan 7-halogenase [Saccharophagus degradans]
MRNITIVGGGTAGWITANILATSWAHQNTNITVIESPTIPTIGVGEGSTPALKGFFDFLEIQESEWMNKCNATYKNGIRFNGWTNKPDFKSYFHPFPSALDYTYLPEYFNNIASRRAGYANTIQSENYFLAAKLAAEKKSPYLIDNLGELKSEVNYGYHFDAAKLAEFLQQHATNLGVKHTVATVQGVTQGPQGIAKIHLSNGESHSADLYIDCTGFSAKLIEQTLGAKFISYADHLYNDAAVSIPSLHCQNETLISSETVATAMENGWAWQIPLQNRVGNGYVYSSQYCSAEQAEQELRTKLGLMDIAVEAKHLTMRVGRRDKHWIKNCVAIGLSQGFIEPLEATALALVQFSAAKLVDYYSIESNIDNNKRDDYNRVINNQFDGIKDYIVAHYKTNSLTHTKYWCDNRAHLDKLSPSLQQIFKCWISGADLSAEIQRQNIQKYYPVVSWYCLLAGMGMFPEAIYQANAVAPSCTKMQAIVGLALSQRECMQHFKAL